MYVYICLRTFLSHVFKKICTFYIQKSVTFVQFWMYLNYAEWIIGCFHTADVLSTNASNCWIFAGEKISSQNAWVTFRTLNSSSSIKFTIAKYFSKMSPTLLDFYCQYLESWIFSEVMHPMTSFLLHFSSQAMQ